MAATVLHIDEIVSDPKIRSGRPVIRGTGLRVEDVMFTHSTGDCLSPEQIAENYRISIGQVHAALAYYYLHKEEMDAAIRADQERAEQLAAELEAQGRLTRIYVDEAGNK
jgi:uncharacterized protein (DUF433 family)